MGYTVDFKTTVWERVRIPDSLAPLVIDKIRNGEINSASEMFGISEDFDCGYETLLDTSEQMLPEENDGFATIELYNDNNEIIYANGKH